MARSTRTFTDLTEDEKEIVREASYAEVPAAAVAKMLRVSEGTVRAIRANNTRYDDDLAEETDTTSISFF